jgi:hypothetical protein
MELVQFDASNGEGAVTKMMLKPDKVMALPFTFTEKLIYHKVCLHASYQGNGTDYSRY